MGQVVTMVLDIAKSGFPGSRLGGILVALLALGVVVVFS